MLVLKESPWLTEDALSVDARIVIMKIIETLLANGWKVSYHCMRASRPDSQMDRQTLLGSIECQCGSIECQCKDCHHEDDGNTDREWMKGKLPFYYRR